MAKPGRGDFGFLDAATIVGDFTPKGSIVA